MYLDLLARRQVDGLLLVPAADYADVLRDLLQRSLPVVLVDRGVPEVAVDAVLSDKRGGGYLATRHLIDARAPPDRLHRGPRPAQGQRPAPPGLPGRHGAGRALPVDDRLVRQGDYHPRSGWAAARTSSLRPDPPTAIFAANDLMAFGVLRAAFGELGRRVPGDLAVVGFDDIELASYTTPPLTTVTQSASDVGRAAVEVLLDRLANPGSPRSGGSSRPGWWCEPLRQPLPMSRSPRPLRWPTPGPPQGSSQTAPCPPPAHPRDPGAPGACRLGAQSAIVIDGMCTDHIEHPHNKLRWNEPYLQALFDGGITALVGAGPTTSGSPTG